MQPNVKTIEPIVEHFKNWYYVRNRDTRKKSTWSMQMQIMDETFSFNRSREMKWKRERKRKRFNGNIALLTCWWYKPSNNESMGTRQLNCENSILLNNRMTQKCRINYLLTVIQWQNSIAIMSKCVIMIFSLIRLFTNRINPISLQKCIIACCCSEINTWRFLSFLAGNFFSILSVILFLIQNKFGLKDEWLWQCWQ